MDCLGLFSNVWEWDNGIEEEIYRIRVVKMDKFKSLFGIRWIGCKMNGTESCVTWKGGWMKGFMNMFSGDLFELF